MATNKDTELSQFIINDVASDELAQQLAEQGQFEEGQLIVTPSSGGSSGEGGGGSTIIWEVWE